MDYEKIEELKNWIAKHDECSFFSKNRIKFETLPKENKFHICEEISALIFLASKLKPEHKVQRSFLHGGRDVILIGQSFDLFQDFTEEDAKICVAHGIFIDESDEGFQILASM